MRAIAIFFLTFFLSNQALADDQKAEFSKAYKAYNAAVEGGDKDQVLATAKKAYEVGAKRFGEGNINTASLALNYGNALIDKNKRDEARPIFKVALKGYEKEYGKNAIELIDPLLGLAEAERHMAEKKRGRIRLGRAIELIEKNDMKDHKLYYDTQLQMGELIYSGWAGSRQKVALGYFSRAHEWAVKHYGEDNAYASLAQFWIGKTRLQSKRYTTSIEYFTNALKGFDSSSPAMHRMRLSTHAFLVEAYDKMGNDEKAVEHCRTIGKIEPKDDVDGQVPLLRAIPDFPRSEAMKGNEGDVVVEFSVDTNGETKDFIVVAEETKGSKAFEKAAIEAVSKFRYAPAYVDGKFVEVKGVRNRITFRLAD